MRPRMRTSTAAWSRVCAPMPVIVIAVPATKTQGSARANRLVAVKARIANEITKVWASTSRVNPAIAGRSSIQTAPQMAPRPTVEVSIAKPSGPRPKTLSANPGKSSTKPRVPIVVTVNSSSIGAIPGCWLA